MSVRNRLRVVFDTGRSLRFIFVLILFSIVVHFNLNLIQAQPSKTSGIPEKIRIAHATPFNSMPIYAAVEKGYFKGKLDVSLQGFPTGRDALNESLQGRADVATVAETPFMYAVMNGVQASIIATISETTNSILIIGRKDKGMIRPVDLKGKKIGVTIGAGGEFFLDNVLVFNGIPRTGVKKVNLTAEKMLRPLLSGEVDAVVSWEPYAQELLDATGANGFAYYGSPTYNRYTWNLVAQRGWVLKNPETVKKMLQALIQGVKFIKKNPSGVHKILAGYTRMDESAMSRMWGSTVFKVALNPSLLMSLEDNARWAIRSKRIDAKTVPNFLNYIYFDGLAAIDPAAVTIPR
jgi:NitT/TauT family transport system substrate-binding protein